MTKANPNHIEKPGYQLTKLGWIPEDWEVTSLEKLVDPQRPISYGIVQTGKPVENGIKCIRVIDLVEGQIDPSKLITTSQKISDSYKRTILQEEDVIIALRGKIGQLGIVSKDLSGANLTRGVALLAATKVEKNYLKHQLSSPLTKKRLERNLNGSALKELSIGVLRKFNIPLPTNGLEQQKIATILSSWDKAIQKQEALIAKKQKLKKGLMQQLLTGKLRFPEFVKSTKTKETKLGEIPEDWELLTVSKLFKFLPTNSFSRAQMNHEYSYDSVFNIHYGDIHATYDHVLLDLDKNDTLVPVLENDLKYNQDAYLKDGDLIVADASEDYKGVGDCIELKNVRGRKVLSGLHTIALRDLTGRTVDGFRAYCLKNSPVAKNLMKLATGSKVYGISKASISRLEILLPSKEEQQKIASVLIEADQEIEKLRQQLEELKTQKKGLMQQLLTGQIRVKTKQYAHETT